MIYVLVFIDIFFSRSATGSLRDEAASFSYVSFKRSAIGRASPRADGLYFVSLEEFFRTHLVVERRTDESEGKENEGKENQRIYVFVSTSLEGLEAQAEYQRLTLRREDYADISDIEDFEVEIIAELEYRKKIKSA